MILRNWCVSVEKYVISPRAGTEIKKVQFCSGCKYRVTHLLANLGWVDLILTVPLAWAGGNLAEVAEQLGKMVVVEQPKSISTQPRFAR